jgi:hypothetical protein
MKKIDKLLEKKVSTYKRNHKGDSFGDVERSKVKRDKISLNKSQKAIEYSIKAVTNTLSDEIADEYEELLYQEKRARGSVKTHGKRLKELSKHEDFN